MSVDTIARRRAARQAHQFRTVLVVGLVGAGLVIACTLMAAGTIGYRAWNSPASTGAGPNPAHRLLGPSPDREGQTWDHKELLAYLNKQGANIGQGGSYFYLNGQVLCSGCTGEELSPAYLEACKQGQPDGLVEVTKFTTSQHAKDRAGVLGDRGASWGRFAFSGCPKLIKHITDRLPR